MKKVLWICVIAIISCVVFGGVAMGYAQNYIGARIVNDDSFETTIVADAVVTDEQFGADNNGVKDSTEAIKKAISYVAEIGGGGKARTSVNVCCGRVRYVDYCRCCAFVGNASRVVPAAR